MNLKEALERTRATPWKAAAEIRRIAVWPWIRFYLARRGVAVGRGWRIYGAPVIQRHRGSRIAIGENVELRSWPRSSPIGVWHPCTLATWTREASIEIGASFGMTGGVICAGKRVSIGDNVFVGANCTIIDTDFHPLAPNQRRLAPSAGAAAEVIIEDEVFIGTQALILKGAHIGRGSVLGAGSVATGEIPAGVIAAGNPARIIGEVRSSLH